MSIWYTEEEMFRLMLGIAKEHADGQGMLVTALVKKDAPILFKFSHHDESVHAGEKLINTLLSTDYEISPVDVFYTTIIPCTHRLDGMKSCAEIIKEAGIRKVIYASGYLSQEDDVKFFEENSIELVNIEDEVLANTFSEIFKGKGDFFEKEDEPQIKKRL